VLYLKVAQQFAGHSAIVMTMGRLLPNTQVSNQAVEQND
jgi:hypothetical protein